MPATLRELAELKPSTLAIMHGASFRGDCAAALNSLADAYEATFRVTRLATYDSPSDRDRVGAR